jgi:hypothetical protein
MLVFSTSSTTTSTTQEKEFIREEEVCGFYFMMRLWPFVFNGDRGNFARIAVVGAAAASQATNRKDLGRGNGRDLAAKSLRLGYWGVS